MEEQGCGSNVGLATSMLPVLSGYLCHKWQVLKSRVPATRRRVCVCVCVSSFSFTLLRMTGDLFYLSEVTLGIL